MMMMITIIMNVKGGLRVGVSGGGGKERILKGEENQSTIHIHMRTVKSNPPNTI
jgi:hypothetical protein